MKRQQINGLQLNKTAVSNLTEIRGGAPANNTGFSVCKSCQPTDPPSDPTGNYSLPLSCDKNC